VPREAEEARLNFVVEINELTFDSIIVEGMVEINELTFDSIIVEGRKYR